MSKQNLYKKTFFHKVKTGCHVHSPGTFNQPVTLFILNNWRYFLACSVNQSHIKHRSCNWRRVNHNYLLFTEICYYCIWVFNPYKVFNGGRSLCKSYLKMKIKKITIISLVSLSFLCQMKYHILADVKRALRYSHFYLKIKALHFENMEIFTASFSNVFQTRTSVNKTLTFN